MESNERTNGKKLLLILKAKFLCKVDFALCARLKVIVNLDQLRKTQLRVKHLENWEKFVNCNYAKQFK